MAWSRSEQRRPHALRGRALQRRNAELIASSGARCQRCGGQRCGNQRLEINHRDGNHANNHPSNLEVLGGKPCHQEETQRQASAARARYAIRRAPEQHPGLR